MVFLSFVGSLGTEITRRYLPNNHIFLYSRDECKHWSLGLEFQHHPHLSFVIGNIADHAKVLQTLIRLNVDIIIMAAAMKHIDKCEYESNECIQTNLLGTQNVLNVIETHRPQLSRLQSVCFVSTDKACSPVNLYGMTKAASECLMIEKVRFIPDVKFVCVRYGNVLNSRGSIIPMLHRLGQDSAVPQFTLTHPDMTRFVMTLEQSVNLIEHALLHADSGDVVIPKLISCVVSDLLDIFADLYAKPVVLGQLRPGEKMLESLINETQSMRLVHGVEGYMHIKPPYAPALTPTPTPMDYNSTINPLSRDALRDYLSSLGLLAPPNL